jgi:hypothetical protein
MGTRPKRFYLKGMAVPDEAVVAELVPVVEAPAKKPPFLERDLHLATPARVPISFKM